MNKSNLGEKGLFCPTEVKSHSVDKGSQSRNTGQETGDKNRSRSNRRILLTGSLNLLSYITWDKLAKSGTSQSGPGISSINQENVL